jgi:ribulose-bisphosphate carboxylase large chain
MEEMTVLKYLDFVDLTYKPLASDLVCTFTLEPEGISLKEAAGAIAAESSIGTWTELTTEQPYVKALAAHVFSLEGNTAKIAYPIELFEPENMPNILTAWRGTCVGLKHLRTCGSLTFIFRKN